MSKKILITTFGSMGDVNPYIGLARRLKEQAHCPIIATSEFYRAAVEKAGIGFCPVRPDVDPGDYELLRRVMQPKTGVEILIREILLPHLRESYEDLLEVSRGSDLLITHPITYAGPLVAEKTRVPWISTVLAPLSFFSGDDMPVFPAYPHLKKFDFLGPWTGKLLLRLVRFVASDWSRPIRQLRAEIGLPAGKDPIFEGQFAPEMTLGLFSPLLTKHRAAAFDARRSDDLGPPPEKVAAFQLGDPGRYGPPPRICGFLFYDEAVDEGTEDAESSVRLEKFLDSGAPPVVFTLGSSSVLAAGEFYRDSFKAARMLGIRAVLLAGTDPGNRPAGPLPDEIAVFDYVPYSKIFPRAAAVVHHGGIGTTAQALRAGKPMLVVPFAFDQPDNAFRLNRLGVARTINRHRYSALRAAKELKILIGDPGYSKRAEAAGRAVRSENGLKAACDAIEEMIGACAS